MITFEEWKKQYCAEPTPQILDDLKRLHNVKDPENFIEKAQKTEYERYCKYQYLKNNPSLTIQTKPAKQASDKSILLAELLDPTVPKSDREYVAIWEIESLEASLLKHQFEIERLKKVAKKLKADIELQNKDWCDDDEAIKQQALRVLPKEVVEGDSVHVPRMGELAEMMADEIERLRVWNNRWRDLAAKLQLSFKDWAMDL